MVGGSPQKADDPIFKNLEDAVDKLNNKFQGADNVMGDNKAATAAHSTEQNFAVLLARSAKFNAMQQDVDKVQKDGAQVSTNVASLQAGQQEGFNKMEKMMQNIMMAQNQKTPSPAPSHRIDPSPGVVTLPTSDTIPLEETVSAALHDKLVALLDLKPQNHIVLKAKPTDTPVSFSRWLGKVLPSKRAQSWIEIIKNNEMLNTVIPDTQFENADNLDDVYGMLTAHSTMVLAQASKA